MASDDAGSQPSVSPSAVNENTAHKAESETRLPSTEATSACAAECPVCLQPCIYPVQLPCLHIFCFLCVKGVAGRNRRCALCRADIPQDFIRRPVLVGKDAVTISDPASADLQNLSGEDKFRWYYEGAGGWWEYDERTSIEIEKYQNHREDNIDSVPAAFELLIAGFIYIIDLENRVQYRRGYPTRRRRIKRDLVGIPDCKGVAGLVCRKKLSERRNGDGTEAAADDTGALVQSVQDSSSNPTVDSQPTVSLADSSDAADSNEASSSVVTRLSGVTQQLAHLEISGNLQQHQHNGQHQDEATQDTVVGHDRQRQADELDTHSS